MTDIRQEEKKNAVIKTLAIIGFMVALFIAVWIAIQAVRLLPVAFSSLASLAESIRNGNETEFTIASNETIVNTGQVMTLSWTTLRAEGDYTFSYQCVNGVSAEIRNSRGDIVSIECDTEISLPTDGQKTEIVFESEKNRFTDVRYTVRFVADNNAADLSRDGFVTIVNPEISSTGTAVDDSRDDETDDEEETDTSHTGTSGQTQGYITVPVVTTSYPTSNPNGFTDLEVTYLGVGTYSNGKFTQRASLEEGEDGALQFAVKNIGTRTSGLWYFNAELPTDPTYTYSSNAQSALLPNERQIITVRFENISDDRNERVDVRITGGNDTRTNNNSSTTRVDIR